MPTCCLALLQTSPTCIHQYSVGVSQIPRYYFVRLNQTGLIYHEMCGRQSGLCPSQDDLEAIILHFPKLNVKRLSYVKSTKMINI